MITAVGMIKNSADIIESCIRCNSNIVDNFVLLNNMSTDRTGEILDSLIKEGFQIEVIPDNIIAKAQGTKITNLLYYCKQKYNSDLYIPIDDDEVIFPLDPTLSGDKIKYYLNHLGDSRNLLYVKSRIYFPFETDDSNEICIPKRFTYYFDESITPSPKCIIPGKLLEDGSFILSQGSHTGQGNLIENYMYQPDLLLAHYPCRTTEQVASKIAIGWLANLSNKNRGSNWGYHLQSMFNIIKSGVSINIELVKAMAAQHLGRDPKKIVVNKNQINLPEKCFDIRYTKLNEFDSLKNLIKFCEEMSNKLGILLPPQYYNISDNENERYESFVNLCIYAENLAINFAKNVVES